MIYVHIAPPLSLEQSLNLYSLTSIIPSRFDDRYAPPPYCIAEQLVHVESPVIRILLPD